MAATVLGLCVLSAGIHSAAAATKQHVIESIELRGTKRLTLDSLQSAIRLQPGDPIDDDIMVEVRARLLGLGLFENALFSLQRATSPERAKLIITVTDDTSVMGESALGGEFALIATDQHTGRQDNSPFRSYNLGLIARNLYGSRHRAALKADIDVKGSLASGFAAYGLPRFTAEAVQFDAMIFVSDPHYRYLETKAFGLKIESIWTRSIRWGDFQYGASWYSNTHKRYRLEGWPEVVAGPHVGLVRETRFLGFMPSEGWKLGVSFIPSLVHRDEFVTDAVVAGTWIPLRQFALTSEVEALTVGRKGITTRGLARLDVPITDSNIEGTKAILFLTARQGYDRFDGVNISGSDAMVGIRYHSQAFIGEFAFQFSRKSPFAAPENDSAFTTAKGDSL